MTLEELTSKIHQIRASIDNSLMIGMMDFDELIQKLIAEVAPEPETQVDPVPPVEQATTA